MDLLAKLNAIHCHRHANNYIYHTPYKHILHWFISNNWIGLDRLPQFTLMGFFRVCVCVFKFCHFFSSLPNTPTDIMLQVLICCMCIVTIHSRNSEAYSTSSWSWCCSYTNKLCAECVQAKYIFVQCNNQNKTKKNNNNNRIKCRRHFFALATII